MIGNEVSSVLKVLFELHVDRWRWRRWP